MRSLNGAVLSDAAKASQDTWKIMVTRTGSRRGVMENVF
jgi:hypothetical protein